MLVFLHPLATLYSDAGYGSYRSLPYPTYTWYLHYTIYSTQTPRFRHVNRYLDSARGGGIYMVAWACSVDVGHCILYIRSMNSL